MKLVIMIGVPGSGKSTKAKTLSRHVHEADTYPNLYRNGKIQFHLLKQSHEHCIMNIESDMKNKIPLIIQSNTNLNKKDLIPYLHLAILYHYEIEFMLPSFGLLHFDNNDSYEQQQIIVKLIRSSGDKLIPPDIMDKMIYSFEIQKEFIQSLSLLRINEMIDKI
jgi:predicted kinase